MSAAHDAAAALRKLADGPARKRKPATPADDAAWGDDVRIYAELAPLVRAASAKLERLKDKLKAELLTRGGEGAEIVTSAGIVGLEGYESPAYTVDAGRRRKLTLRGTK